MSEEQSEQNVKQSPARKYLSPDEVMRIERKRDLRRAKEQKERQLLEREMKKQGANAQAGHTPEPKHPIVALLEAGEDQVVGQLDSLDEAHLEAVRAMEVIGQSRDAVLDAVAEKLDVGEGGEGRKEGEPPVKTPVKAEHQSGGYYHLFDADDNQITEKMLKKSDAEAKVAELNEG